MADENVLVYIEEKDNIWYNILYCRKLINSTLHESGSQLEYDKSSVVPQDP